MKRFKLRENSILVFYKLVIRLLIIMCCFILVYIVFIDYVEKDFGDCVWEDIIREN